MDRRECGLLGSGRGQVDEGYHGQWWQLYNSGNEPKPLNDWS